MAGCRSFVRERTSSLPKMEKAKQEEEKRKSDKRTKNRALNRDALLYPTAWFTALADAIKVFTE